MDTKNYINKLLVSKNLILRGAPGTGKSYLAKKIAADIITNGEHDDYTKLSQDQKEQVEFVQFHPSYDYSDFVEGLRPKLNDDGTMGFKLQDGIFKKFVARARENYENLQKPKETIEKEMSVQEAMSDFFLKVKSGELLRGNPFTITKKDDKEIRIDIPKNPKVKELSLDLDRIRKLLESGKDFGAVKDVTTFFGQSNSSHINSYEFVIWRKIKDILDKKRVMSDTSIKQEELKKYIFIIDEINRGEISKIFGELFFAIDPGYRGKNGEISTQYSTLHDDPDEKFYVPENLYIIGTMNDIDRSVDSFDFAMRRRFRFVELKANECTGMLDALGDELKNEAIRRMKALNKKIEETDDLNESYQIGASYFLKLKDNISFDELWTDYLQPLLQEYIHGMHNEKDIMTGFEKAYYRDENETVEDNKG